MHKFSFVRYKLMVFLSTRQKRTNCTETFIAAQSICKNEQASLLSKTFVWVTLLPLKRFKSFLRKYWLCVIDMIPLYFEMFSDLIFVQHYVNFLNILVSSQCLSISKLLSFLEFHVPLAGASAFPCEAKIVIFTAL